MKLVVIPATVSLDGNKIKEVITAAKELIKDERNNFGMVSRENRKSAIEFKNKLGSSFSYIETLRKKVKAEINAPYEAVKKDLDAISKVFKDEKEVYSSALKVIDDEDKVLIANMIDKAVNEGISEFDVEFNPARDECLEVAKTRLGSITPKGELVKSVLIMIEDHVKACDANAKLVAGRKQDAKSKNIRFSEIKGFILLEEDEYNKKIALIIEHMQRIETDTIKAIQALSHLEGTKITAIINGNERTVAIKKLEAYVVPDKLKGDSYVISTLKAGMEYLNGSVPVVEVKPVPNDNGTVTWNANFSVTFEFKSIGTGEQINTYLRKMYKDTLDLLEVETSAIRASRKGYAVSEPFFKAVKGK